MIYLFAVSILGSIIYLFGREHISNENIHGVGAFSLVTAFCSLVVLVISAS